MSKRKVICVYILNVVATDAVTKITSNWCCQQCCSFLGNHGSMCGAKAGVILP